MADDPNGEMKERAEMVRLAYDALVAAVQRMWGYYRPEQTPAEIMAEIKGTMHDIVPPHDSSVFDTLCERERDKVFNSDAAVHFPDVHHEFTEVVASAAAEAGASTRSAQRIAKNAWKQDAAADRRIREMEKLPESKWRSPYRARPELNPPPAVVRAFVKRIARAAGRARFTRGNRSGGIMLDVLVTAVDWAMLEAWRASAPFGTDPPKAAREGLLKIIRVRPTD